MIKFIHELQKDEFIIKFLHVMELKAKTSVKIKSEYILENRSENYICTFFGLDLTKLIFIANNKYHLWILVYKYILKHSNMKYIKYIITTDKNFNLDEQIYEEYFENEPYNIGNYKYLMDVLYGNCFSEKFDTKNITMDTFVDEIIADFFDNEFLVPILIRKYIGNFNISKTII
jgi:hypothetical protein